MGLGTRKPVLGVCEHQMRRPVCPFVQSGQHLCYSLIWEVSLSRLDMSEISIFYLISVAEQTIKDRFSLHEAHNSDSFCFVSISF